MTHRWRVLAVILLALCTSSAGALAWRFRSASPILHTLVFDAPVREMAMDPGAQQVFIPFSDARGGGSLLMVSTDTGALRKTLPFSDVPSSLVVSSSTGRVFLMHSGPLGAQLAVIDSQSGVVLHNTPMDPVAEALAVEEAPGSHVVRHVYLASTDTYSYTNGAQCRSQPSRVQQLDAASGSPSRALFICGLVQDMAVDGRAGRLITHCGQFLCLNDLQTGQSLRSLPLQQWSDWGGMVVDERTGRAFISVSLQPNGDSGSILVLATQSGALLRTVALPTAPGALALDAKRGRVYALTLGPARLTTYTGISNPTTPPGGTISVSIAGLNPTGPGSLVAIDARTGVLLRSTPVCVSPMGIAVDAATGRVFVTCSGPIHTQMLPPGSSSYAHWSLIQGRVISLYDRGSLIVLDGATGHVLHTVAVGYDPIQVALDPLRQRVLVLNAGGVPSGLRQDPWSWLPNWVRHRLPFFPPPAPPRLEPSSLTVLDDTRLR